MLDGEDHRRLIDEAIGELDFSALERPRRRRPWQPRIACTRARSSKRRRSTDASRPSSEGLRRFPHGGRRGARAAQPAREPAARPDREARGARASCSTDADELLRNFLLLVAEKGRAAELGAIADELDALVARDQGRLTVELTTAYELTDEDANAIVRKIEASSGRTVEATRRVDPALVGGIMLQAGSMRVDASVRGRLSRLQRALVKGA